MDRLTYFIRRLLLVIPTFLGITLACYALCLFVPGGPVELKLSQMKAGAQGEAGASSSSGAITGGVTEDYKKSVIAYYGFDRPFLVQYWDWLVNDKLGMSATSYKFSNKTVGQLIVERFPISLTFGIVGFVLSYLVCIPLGIAKALRNGGFFDMASSLIVFTGYAIPAFAFGMVLKMGLCGTSDQFWDLFPLGGFRSEDWDTMGFFQQVADQAWHMFLPLLCYVIGSFAVLTLLMKNSLLEQIGQDYVRTVLAKGGTMKRAVWCHAFRNALVPIATGFGSILTVMFASSVLIEKVFDIQGMGLLSLDAIISRDYMVFMGILAIVSVLGLLGRILSDFCYVLIDPRINFSGER